MDDAHVCSDIIRNSCKIRIDSAESSYLALRTLFAQQLELQGVGTYADICNGKYDAFLPVPYWSWTEHEAEVAKILSSNEETTSIKYGWPLLKNMLTSCQSIVSGKAVEIEPYVPPLDLFGPIGKRPLGFLCPQR